MFPISVDELTQLSHRKSSKAKAILLTHMPLYTPVGNISDRLEIPFIRQRLYISDYISVTHQLPNFLRRQVDEIPIT